MTAPQVLLTVDGELEVSDAHRPASDGAPGSLGVDRGRRRARSGSAATGTAFRATDGLALAAGH